MYPYRTTHSFKGTKNVYERVSLYIECISQFKRGPTTSIDFNAEQEVLLPDLCVLSYQNYFISTENKKQLVCFGIFFHLVWQLIFV